MVFSLSQVRSKVFNAGKATPPIIAIKAINPIGIGLQKIQYNSLFTYDYIQKNSSDWQSHLERISDYLIFGEDVWWKKTEFGIEFFDVDNTPANLDLNPKVHHFRSANIRTVTKDLEEHWTSIVENKLCIPTHEILIGHDDEIVQYKKTTFLSDRIKIDNLLPTHSKCSITTAPLNYIEEELEEDLTDFTIKEVDNSVSYLAHTKGSIATTTVNYVAEELEEGLTHFTINNKEYIT